MRKRSICHTTNTKILLFPQRRSRCNIYSRRSRNSSDPSAKTPLKYTRDFSINDPRMHLLFYSVPVREALNREAPLRANVSVSL
ncbi:hypothetical protein M407DRAFT_174562 [Tulasnella calospora MUT 4182]|uniref:Uncharacterized protein n=1 Tax=Tulasnella calospora MUT 4182 TaxID=1051891 RepID=A0A0C3QMD1_9AGAM|nr:hypothetical protein M407DRAFT_174562 [Tulasnella calospora MUT 4182]